MEEKGRERFASKEGWRWPGLQLILHAGLYDILEKIDPN